MKQQDCKVGKGAPVVTKTAVPIREDAAGDCAEIEFPAKSVEHGAVVDTWGGDHGLVGLEWMSAFRGVHG